MYTQYLLFKKQQIDDKKNEIKDFQNGCGTSDLRMTRTQSFGLVRSTELEAEPDHASKSQTRDIGEMEEAGQYLDTTK